jgi:tripartite-type tricarboxylate transporter receptor subunit TctC
MDWTEKTRPWTAGGTLLCQMARLPEMMSGPKEFDAFVKSELVSWTAMIKEAGIQPE